MSKIEGINDYGTEPTTLLLYATPELAQCWLARNTHNRKFSTASILNYTMDMREGCWERTSQGIGFATDGSLLDGQNRLASIIGAAKGAWLLVTINLPLHHTDANGFTFSTQDVLDQGHDRKLKHTFRDQGVPNPDKIAAAVAVLAFLFPEFYRRLSYRTASEILDLFRPGLLAYAKADIARCCNIGSVYAGLALLGSAYPAETDRFVAELKQCKAPSTQFGTHNGPQLLVNYLSSRGAKENAGRNRLKLLRLVIRAFEVWLKKKPMTRFKLPPGNYLYDLHISAADTLQELQKIVTPPMVAIVPENVSKEIQTAPLAKTSIRFGFEVIGPEQAKLLLNGMEPTKSARRKIAMYASMMKDKGWALTHEAIALDTKSNILDGRKRLWAVIQSGTPVTFLVIRNITAAVKKNIGTGAVRRVKDQLYCHNLEAHQASALRLIAQLIGHSGSLTPPQAVHLSKIIGPNINELMTMCS
jgi:hypothetical protein